MFQAKPITRALAIAFGGLACTAVISPALAQTTPPSTQQLERVEITGSAIKRIEGESALPVTTITRQEIDQLGVVNAAQLVDKLVANSGQGYQLSNALGDAARPGFSGASLRGLGSNSTLILLNGRRMAVYAFDGGAVNLQQIPFAAIERVEVLREGASAIYGTDAVAGVINFITRKDYSGVQVYGGYFLPQEEGGEQYQFNLLGGWGDLAKDRFNVFGVFGYTKQESVAAKDREFSKTALRRDISIDENVLGFPYVQRTSSNAFPGNIFTSVGFRSPYASPFVGATPGVTTDPKIGVFPNAGCTPPASYGLTSTEARCRYDYASQIDILPENEVLSFLGRGTFQLNPDTQIFAEASWAKQTSTFRISQTPASGATTKIGADGTRALLLYPEGGKYYPGNGIVPAIPGVALTGDLDIYWRALETGPRTNEVETDEYRILLGVSGLAWGWDYNAGTYYISSEATETYLAGYLLESKLLPTFYSGVINPFGYNDAAGLAALNSTQALGQMRTAKTTAWVIDGVASKEIMNLPAGPMALAVGFQYQDQEYTDTPSAILGSSDIIGGAGEQFVNTGDRTVFSLFGELSIPIIKNLDAQVAVRWDDYSDFGSNVSPKVGLRWQPTSTLLVRGSYGQGFRAPTIPDLVATPARTNSGGSYNDPWYEAQVPGGCDEDAGGIFNPLYCNAQLTVTNSGNKSLEPETSDQWSVGFVFEPTRDFSVGLDFWWIQQTDLIGVPNGDAIIQDCISGFNAATLSCSGGYAQFARSRVSAVAGVGNITVLDTAFNQFLNIADQNTNGVDLEARLRIPLNGSGDLTFNYNATYIFEQEQKNTFLPGAEWESTVGTYATFGPVQRYRHYLSGSWNSGPWTVTVGNNYSSGYEDEYTNADGSTHNVAGWGTWDLYGRWTGVKNLALVLGITNLFNNQPPVTNQQDYFQIGYDPTVVNPLGRVYYLTAQYKFF
jgi:iron complex outermembrane receptor protein